MKKIILIILPCVLLLNQCLHGSEYDKDIEREIKSEIFNDRNLKKEFEHEIVITKRPDPMDFRKCIIMCRETKDERMTTCNDYLPKDYAFTQTTFEKWLYRLKTNSTPPRLTGEERLKYEACINVYNHKFINCKHYCNDLFWTRDRSKDEDYW